MAEFTSLSPFTCLDDSGLYPRLHPYPKTSEEVGDGTLYQFGTTILRNVIRLNWDRQHECFIAAGTIQVQLRDPSNNWSTGTPDVLHNWDLALYPSDSKVTPGPNFTLDRVSVRQSLGDITIDDIPLDSADFGSIPCHSTTGGADDIRPIKVAFTLIGTIGAAGGQSDRHVFHDATTGTYYCEVEIEIGATAYIEGDWIPITTYDLADFNRTYRSIGSGTESIEVGYQDQTPEAEGVPVLPPVVAYCTPSEDNLLERFGTFTVTENSAFICLLQYYGPRAAL